VEDGSVTVKGRERSEYPLKVLSSEMDPVEIRLIRYIFIKGSVSAGFRKICPSPIE
jgi:hypothetical protein